MAIVIMPKMRNLGLRETVIYLRELSEMDLNLGLLAAPA